MVLVEYSYYYYPPCGGTVTRMSRKVFGDEDVKGLQSYLDGLSERKNVNITKI